MGCDIHIYSEVLKEGKWIAEKAKQFQKDEDPYDYMPSTGDRSRNYWLFGLLSKGVRTDWNASFEPKGFPEDASHEVTTLNAQWGEDAHSHNWLTIQELKNKQMELLLVPEDAAINEDLADFITSLHHQENIDPAYRRIVFWFDN